jgi:hypothetical protein
MRKSTLLHSIFFIAAVIFLCSCNTGGFKVEDFDPLVNYDQKQSDTLYAINADLSDAVLNGIEIPTKKQTNTGYFVFSFKIKNTSSDIKKYYYKIFYQNESYKFNDTLPLAHENFYGSWIEGLYTFKPTKILDVGEEVIVVDSFRIVGNPRNEAKYFGPDSRIYSFSPDSINSRMNFVKSVPKWMEDVTRNARKKNISIEQEIYYNAVWSIEFDKKKIPLKNNRWKRNPRMGTYQFMLAVTSPEDIGKIPMEIRNIQLADKKGQFKNPFGYFLLGEGRKLKNTKVILADKRLKVLSQMDLASGVFVDKQRTESNNISTEFYNSSCGNSFDLYTKAQFSQYFHSINTDFTVYNIPDIKDVVGENLTKKEYEEYLKIYQDKNKRVKLFVSTTKCPCATLKSDPQQKKITMINPASSKDELKKEHVGIGSRIGFTYGKFRTKVKFPEMLSKDFVWNGITNAFWLLFQTGEWNNRRDCNSDKGYLPKDAPDHDSAFKQSKKTLDYSEIDFEIVKESQYWPKTSYNHSNLKYMVEDTYNNQVMVTCTNWDMSCHEPPQYDIGVQEHLTDGAKYAVQRWNYYYKALSSKVPANHDELFRSPYYYFEIEWLPEKIIWRVGPEKDKLRVICVMDKTFTSIPNNQMRPMFTQEWHNEEWWPTAPYKQNFIPFPKKDIIGTILEIEIE